MGIIPCHSYMLRRMAVRTNRPLLRVASPVVGSRARSSETWTSASATIAATPNCERRVARRVVLCCNAFFLRLQRAALRSFVFTRSYATVRATTSAIHEYRRVDGSEGLDVSNSWYECAPFARVCLRTACTRTLVRGYSACGVKACMGCRGMRWFAPVSSRAVRDRCGVAPLLTAGCRASCSGA